MDKVIQFREDEYYKDTEFLNFSALKIFSKCQTLYRDTFLLRTYEEPDKDYFIYGSLVDCMITEPKLLEQKFMQVARRVKDEQGLKLENMLKELQTQVSELEAEKAQGKKNDRSITARKKQVREVEEQLMQIKLQNSKIQVVPSLWKNAFETAEAIKGHPFFKQLYFDDLSSQQTFATEVHGVKVKGRLDFLGLSKEASDLYLLFCQNMIDADELKKQFLLLPEDQRKITIVDIKTCHDLRKLEPYNYRGQLSFYQDLVEAVFGARAECYILVGDKAEEYKKAELFHFPQEVLDEIKPDLWAWAQLWRKSITTNSFVSDKKKNGLRQECFTCSECRVQPFSADGGPVEVRTPRFNFDQKLLWVNDEPVAETKGEY